MTEISALPGIGLALATRLRAVGIVTLADLAGADEAVLTGIRGISPARAAAFKAAAGAGETVAIAPPAARTALPKPTRKVVSRPKPAPVETVVVAIEGVEVAVDKATKKAAKKAKAAAKAVAEKAAKAAKKAADKARKVAKAEKAKAKAAAEKAAKAAKKAEKQARKDAKAKAV